MIFSKYVLPGSTMSGKGRTQQKASPKLCSLYTHL